MGYGFVTKSVGVGYTFEDVVEKTNCQKMNVDFLQPNWEESSHLVSRGQNP